MNPTPAQTLAAPVTLRGRALFAGVPSTLTVRPAPLGAGLVIRHKGSETPATIEHLSDAPAHPAFAGQRPRCTSVGDPPVAMTEHAMAALAGLGITDAVLECDSCELPIDDGSCKALAEAIMTDGVQPLDTWFEPIVLREPMEYRRGDALITAEPCNAIDYRYHLDYGPGSPIAESIAQWSGNAADFAASIAPARTFSTLAEAEQAASLGLFESFTPADLLVIGPEGPVENELRFPDECARHKLLDLIGDLALLGRPLFARVHAHRSGHADTHAFCRMIRTTLPG
ncbi:MAG: UDP-3-O-acyl-N-acetylglucosamine deacetylase [Planctomycetota bacterium]